MSLGSKDLRLILIPLAAMFFLGSGGIPDPSDWVLEGGLDPVPEPSDSLLPLSHQGEAGRIFEPNRAFWDEFDGTELDASRWQGFNPDWKGRQPAFFSPLNVTVRKGFLTLLARREAAPENLKAQGYRDYSTAAVQSRERVLYGYFECRARPMASGVSSAFWFYKNEPERWTEIDVFEIGGKAPGFEKMDNMNAIVFHTPDSKEQRDHHAVWDAPWNFESDYHVFGVDWNEKAIEWFVDGVLVRRLANTDWHQALTLNFDSETMPNWFGMPRDADLPSTFSVDYIRAWKRKSLLPHMIK